MNNQLINETIEYVRVLFEGNSGGHDVEHTMRVYRNAMRLAELEQAAISAEKSGAQSEQREVHTTDLDTGLDTELIALAALLHDADDYKLFQTENNKNARTFLSEKGLADDRIDEICRAINSVSFSKNQGKKPETLEGEIVQDADRLDAIGAIGIARTFAFGGEHGRGIEDSVMHFHEKLLKLKSLMNTESAKRLAEERDAFMRQFLEQLRDETGIE